MNYIKGKVRTTIFSSERGFFVGTFKIKETNEEDLIDFLNKSITITGNFVDLNTEDTYILYGKYTKHDRYGFQYQVDSSSKEIPSGNDAVTEFLSSPLIKGCGEKTAMKIVEVLGPDAIHLIKDNIHNLYLIPQMTNNKAQKIYDSILAYSSSDDLIIRMKTLGFSIYESTNIINRFKERTSALLEENLYSFQEIIDFAKLDAIFLKNYNPESEIRIDACIIESMKRLGDSNGDIYYFKEEIYTYLKSYFHIFLELDVFQSYLNRLEARLLIVIQEDRIYLAQNYEQERSIANQLLDISLLPKKEHKNIENMFESLETELEVKYNDSQKKAITTALMNRITIISGGPGTGKTTIVNAITKLFIALYHLTPIEIYTSIALVAPTGRASKKLSLSTNLPASTIHRYLKWNKETNEFQINENHKNNHRLVIVDEMSMIDTFLFDSLLKGIPTNTQLILVGDTFQLPSVGAGLVLNDLVESKLFAYCPLDKIYRQSENSYIPFLAKEIKEKQLSPEFTEKTDDYNFITCDNSQIKEVVYQICEKSQEKGLRVDDIQILAPMYKGENGIDNLNLGLQNLFNPKDEDKKEIKSGEFIYREGDKVLQLVNNPDCNVYNGDIGYIKSILMTKTEYSKSKKEQITIDFDGNYVVYSKEDLYNIKHAYAMTIHKSQGSEFPHVILPISKNYYKMLYNKLIYTGVSRAKKSLMIIGDVTSFLQAIENDYSTNRKTSLKEVLLNKFQ